jgi:hypothetical protein
MAGQTKPPRLEGMLCEMVAREFKTTGCYGPLVTALRERQEFERQRAVESDDRYETARARRNIGHLAGFMRAAGVSEDGLVAATVPAAAVGLVRSGLLCDLGTLAAEIRSAIEQASYDKMAGLLRRQDATRALLDRIAWEAPERQRLVTVYLDAPEHRQALARGLHNALERQRRRADDPDITEDAKMAAEDDRALLGKLLSAIGEPPLRLAPGERRLTPEEFDQHFGQLPTDGEG